MLRDRKLCKNAVFIDCVPLKMKKDNVNYVVQCKSKYPDIQNQIILTVWDYAGQELFYQMHTLFLTRYGIYLVVFDMEKLLNDTKYELNRLKFWLDSIYVHAQGAPFILIGTHKDKLEEREESLKSLLDGINTIILKVSIYHLKH